MKRDLSRIDLSDTQKYFSVSSEDLNLYFANTFLFSVGDNAWIHVLEFYNDDESGKPRMSYKSPRVNSCLINEKTINFAFPEVGLYNFKQGVVFVYRKTQRQNKKGLCDGTIGIHNLYYLYERFFYIPTQFKISQLWKWIPSNVNLLFEKTSYSSLDEAFIRIKRLKDFSRAINKDFFVGQGIESSNPLLWFKQSLVGELPEKGKIVVRNSLFLQEVLDVFLPLGVAIDTDKNASIV